MKGWSHRLRRGTAPEGRAPRRAQIAGAALALALTTSVALLAGAPAIAKAPPAGAATPAVVVTVRPTARGAQIPAGFVGLSLEYRTLLSYAGTDPMAVNPVFVRLLQGIAPGQSPVLRIGGDSTDWSWWPVPRMKRPPGITYDVTPAWTAVARALAHVTGARYILGVNLEAGNRAIELAEAHALLSGIGPQSIAALELGNEPELYSRLGWYYTRQNVPVFGRPPSYDFAAFTNQFSGFRRAIAPIPTAGPSTGNYWWLGSLPSFLAAEPTLGMVTVHSYWLNRCLSARSSPGYPTIPNLLRPTPPSRLALSLRHYARLAHAHGTPIRIDEMNSVTCGGQRGVSDVFASALWALDALFEAMSDGVDGVNIHTFPGTANQLFGFSHAGGRWAATVRPEYYGLRMFAQATPVGGRLLRIVQLRDGHVRAWATMGTRGVVRVVVINDSLTSSSNVLVRTPTPGEPAEVERLTAPSASATRGITLGGQSFGAPTATGTPSGTPSTFTLQTPPSSNGIASYQLTMPAASAAMLTIDPPR